MIGKNSISFKVKFVTNETKLLEEEMDSIKNDLAKLNQDILNCSISEFKIYRAKIDQKEKLYQNMLDRLLQIERIMSQKDTKKEICTTFELEMFVEVLFEFISRISEKDFEVDNLYNLNIENYEYEDKILDFLSFVILERIENNMFDFTKKDFQKILDKYLEQTK